MEEVRRIDEECKEVCNQETEEENDVTQFLASDPWLSWGEERKNPVCNERGLSKIAGTTKEAKNFIQNPEKMYRFAVLMLTTTVEVVDLKKSLDTIVNEVKEEIQAYCVSERKPLQMNFVEAQESLDILIKAKGMGFLQLQSDTIANQSRAEGSGTEEATVWFRAEFTLTARNSGGDPCFNKMGLTTVEAKD